MYIWVELKLFPLLFYGTCILSYLFRLQGIKIYWLIHFLEYLRTLSLKFQKATSKIKVFLSLPCWLSQFSWDSQQGTARKTSILILAIWNFKLKVHNYPRNCRLHATLILNLGKLLVYTKALMYFSSINKPKIYYLDFFFIFQMKFKTLSCPSLIFLH